MKFLKEEYTTTKVVWKELLKSVTLALTFCLIFFIIIQFTPEAGKFITKMSEQSFSKKIEVTIYMFPLFLIYSMMIKFASILTDKKSTK